MFGGGAMREIEYCMRYANSCKRCPLNRICEGEYQRERESGGRGGKRPSDLSVLRNSSERASMRTQEKQNQGHKRTGGQVQEHKSMGNEKRRGSTER